MTLPSNLAKPTLVTGKTNQSQVVDVYSTNAAVEASSVQNTIATVLTSSSTSFLGGLVKGVSKVLNPKTFYSDMVGVINKVAKGGDLSSAAIASALGDYKNGALKTVLESTGLGGLNGPGSFKDNLVKSVTTNAQAFGFNTLQGFSNALAPGLLDSAGVKSFADVKNVYNGTVYLVRDLKSEVSKGVSAVIGDNITLLTSLAASTLTNTIDVVNTVLDPVEKVTNIKNISINNAILAAGTTDAVVSNDADLNGYILDSFGGDTDSLRAYLATMLPKAVASGSYHFINKAVQKTDRETVSWYIGGDVRSYLSHVNVTTKPTDANSRLIVQEEIITSLEAVSWANRDTFTVATFKGITNSVYDVLKYGQYANLASLAKTSKPLTAKELINTSFNDFVIT